MGWRFRVGDGGRLPVRPGGRSADAHHAHDPFFTPEGGESYLTDLPDAEIHRLNAGHFATEDNLSYIASHIISFYDARVKAP